MYKRFNKKVFLLAACVLFVAGCSSQTPNSNDPSHHKSAPAVAESNPSASEHSNNSGKANFVIPKIDPKAIAYTTYDSKINNGHNGQVDADKRYKLEIACKGTDSARYTLTVAGTVVNEGTIPCGQHNVNSALLGKAGLVQINLVPNGAEKGEPKGIAQILPDDSQ